MYAKDHVEKCYIFEPEMLGHWITKSPVRHFFSLSISNKPESCNVMQASCAYFDGNESGTFLRYANLTTLKYSVSKKEIEYELPTFIHSAITKSDKYVKAVGKSLKLRWNKGAWQCDELVMQINGSNMGTFVKTPATSAADYPATEQTYKQLPRTDMMVLGVPYMADGNVEIKMSGNTVTVTHDDESASGSIELSGLSPDDYQLIKVKDAKMLKLLQGIKTTTYNSMVYNRAVVDVLGTVTLSYKITMVLPSGKQKPLLNSVKIPSQLIQAFFTKTPPPKRADKSINIENYGVDVSDLMNVPLGKTTLKQVLVAAPDGNLKSVRIDLLRIEFLTNSFVMPVKQGNRIFLKIRSEDSKLKDLETLRTPWNLFVPAKVGTYVPLQIKSGSFKIGSRPTFDFLAPQVSSAGEVSAPLRFGPA